MQNTLRGNIIKKLPRKTAVSIKDTAVFSVELEQKCEKFRWLKNKEELKPRGRISISSTDREYTMIIRDCQMEDGGEIVFVADECRTSTQFTVSGESDSPLPCIEGVCFSIFITYKLQTSSEDLRCLMASLVSQTEFMVNNMTEEADYQFRVSAVNKYGQSDFLEFPGVWHLVKTPMRNVEVAPGRDATFTVDLTTPSPGSWYINGNLVQNSDKYIITRTKASHSLIIKRVTSAFKEAEVKFVAKDIESIGRSSHNPVHFILRNRIKLSPENVSLSCEVAQTKTDVKWYKDGKLITDTKKFKIEEQDEKIKEIFVNKEKVQKDIKTVTSENVSLSCEVAQTKADVKWYKDGKLITNTKKFKIEEQGGSRCLVVQQVEKKDAGEYTCEADGQKLTFKVTVVQKDINVVVSENISLSCEVAQAKAEVKWFKDGKLITSNKKFTVEAKDRSHHLVVQQAEKKDAGEYTCEVDGQMLNFQVTVTGRKKTLMVFAEKKRRRRRSRQRRRRAGVLGAN
uniref:Ig-like domain-containing protein n=1 Tax=Naja naja TaxID=35670 RepID=A0A8C6XFF7_NAJNA